MKHIVIVSGCFADRNGARKLASHSDIRITFIDKSNDQQFQPWLCQVETDVLAPSNAALSVNTSILTSRAAGRSEQSRERITAVWQRARMAHIVAVLIRLWAALHLAP
jgi:NADH dehydrogenase FAD-containing subunit